MGVWVSTSRKYANGFTSLALQLAAKLNRICGTMVSGFARNEQPVLPADGRDLHGAFGKVVVNRQITVFAVTQKCVPLVQSVPARLTDRTLGQHMPRLLPNPFPQRLQDRQRMLATQFAPPFAV